MADIGDAMGLLREAQRLLAPPQFAEEALDPELRIERAEGLALVAIGLYLDRMATTLETMAIRS